jgi:hypothetical protein
MLAPFFRSTSGRLILAAAAIFLASGAAGVVWHNLYAVGIGYPVAITLSFVGVGLGLGEYTKEALFSVTVMPPMLWGFYFLTEELRFAQSTALGYGMILVALICAGKAAFPGSED